MNAEKVKTLHSDKENPNPGEEKTEAKKKPFANTPKDMSKVAIVISILSVLLLVVFFFGMNQNLQGLSAKVEKLSGMESQIQAIDSKVSGLEQEISGLKNLPQKTRNMVLANSLQEMSQKASMLSSQVNNEDQSAKLIKARKLMQEVQGELSSNSN